MINEKSRNWNLVLYPKEDDTHYFALQYIINNYKKYAYINHNSDINDLGELKKEHVHVVISFDNARYRNSIADELKITPNYIEKCISLDDSLKYLIHYNLKNKFQYSIDDVYGSLKDKLIQLLDSQDLTMSEQLLEIMQFIERYNSYLSISTFLHFISNSCFLNTYRKFSYAIHQLIQEHNIYYSSHNNKDT